MQRQQEAETNEVSKQSNLSAETMSRSLTGHRSALYRFAACGMQSRRLTPEQRTWRQIEVPPGMGLDCDNYKWRQSQSHLELFVRLPHRPLAHQVSRHVSSIHTHHMRTYSFLPRALVCSCRRTPSSAVLAADQLWQQTK